MMPTVFFQAAAKPEKSTVKQAAKKYATLGNAGAYLMLHYFAGALAEERLFPKSGF